MFKLGDYGWKCNTISEISSFSYKNSNLKLLKIHKQVCFFIIM